MLWHFFALSAALERVAVAEAAASRASREEERRSAAPASVADAHEDFAWT
jgi:hypothetical protein